MQQYYDEGIQLHYVLQSFRSAISQEAETGDAHTLISLSTAIGMCYSALIALYDCHSCAEEDNVAGVGIPEQLKLQEISLSGLKEVGISVSELAMNLTTLMSSHGSMTASPFLASCLYSAAKNYLWYIHETGNTDLQVTIDALTGALNALGIYWGNASKYSSWIWESLHDSLTLTCAKIRF
jgi:hypothetical protein